MIRAPVMALAAVLSACGGQQMDDQPRYEAYEAADYFTDGRSAREPPEGAVPWGAEWRDPAAVITAEVTPALIGRGRERYRIYCVPCHGPGGEGQGRIVQHGFPAPPSLLEPRLRSAPDAHLYRVIGEGYGIMYGYANRVPIGDRLAIVAYLRALQLSRHAPVSELPEALRSALPP